MSAFQAVRIPDVENKFGWAPLRAHLGIQSFGINAFTGREPGAVVIPDHDELGSGHEEVYVVLTGRATFTIAGEELDAPPGTVVHVPAAATERGAVAAADDTTVLAVGALPGEAFQPMAWEVMRDVLDLFDRGDAAGAKRVLTAAIETYGEQPVVLYNLACSEALLGESDAALDHLAAAVAGRPSFAENAHDDDDFASLREDARFAEIVGRT